MQTDNCDGVVMQICGGSTLTYSRRVDNEHAAAAAAWRSMNWVNA